MTPRARAADAAAPPAEWDGRHCLGCGQPAYAGRHLIDVDRTTIVAWHPDCHAAATGCEVCQNVISAHPGVKDHALGAAILKKNPNKAVSYGGAHFGEPHSTTPPPDETAEAS